MTEERPGFAGALPSAGGLGGGQRTKVARLPVRGIRCRVLRQDRGRARPSPDPAPSPGAIMNTPRHPIPESFVAWVLVSPDDEVLALLRLVQIALERRGYVPRVEWAKPT